GWGWPGLTGAGAGLAVWRARSIARPTVARWAPSSRASSATVRYRCRSRGTALLILLILLGASAVFDRVVVEQLVRPGALSRPGGHQGLDPLHQVGVGDLGPGGDVVVVVARVVVDNSVVAAEVERSALVGGGIAAVAHLDFPGEFRDRGPAGAAAVPGPTGGWRPLVQHGGVAQRGLRRGAFGGLRGGWLHHGDGVLEVPVGFVVGLGVPAPRRRHL